MKIMCWNVAGLRACLKRGSLDWIKDGRYDMICLQETKALESEVTIPDEIAEAYPYRYWRSCQGEGGQRKGLSGTAIWSRTKARAFLPIPEFDKEGRITSVDMGEFILLTVYTPNSQSPASDRCSYRINKWDNHFRTYVATINNYKPVIICGDFNVAHHDRDVYNPEEWRNTVAGFLDNERANFQKLLDFGFVDAYRQRFPDAERRYTFWDQKLPFLRKCNRGWRIDYFLVSEKMKDKIRGSAILSQVQGSDHCPITLTIETKQKRLEIR